MFKKLFIFTCLIALTTPFSAYAKAKTNETCIGQNYPQGVPLDDVTLPKVKIISDKKIIDLKAGESFVLTASAQYDSNHTTTLSYQWCADEKGQLEKLNNDFSSVRYTAPDLQKQKIIPVSVTFGDGLGYVNGDTIFIRVASDQTNPAAEQYKIQVFVRDQKGKGLGYAVVQLNNNYSETTNNGGHTKFELLKAGNYSLAAKLNGYTCQTIPVMLDKKPVVSITISCESY